MRHDVTSDAGQAVYDNSLVDSLWYRSTQSHRQGRHRSGAIMLSHTALAVYSFVVNKLLGTSHRPWRNWLLSSGLMVLVFVSQTAWAGEPLQVITYNIRYQNQQDGADRWEHRAETVAKTLATVDVMGLQEVVVTQLQELQQRLPEYQFIGVGREDGKERGEYCPIGFKSKRFELIRSGTFWLSPHPDQVGEVGWDAMLPRVATWLVLKDRTDQQSWFFLNTHFDHRGEEARLLSAQLLVRQCPSLAPSLPWVVMGDFNATPDSEPIQAILMAKQDGVPLLEDARDRSLKSPEGPTGTWNGFKAIDLQTRIDHLFVNRQVKVNEIKVLDPRTPADRFASDHLPVLAAIELANQATPSNP